jgi:Flp pilus assembly protein TadG
MFSFIGRMTREEQGSLATLYALALVPLVGAAAVALDYSKASRDRTELQKAVDAAALGAVEPDDLDDQKRVALAKSLLAANDRLGASQAVATAVTSGERSVTIVASAKSPAALISSLGIADIPVSARAKAIKKNDGAPICVLALNRSVAGAVSFSGNTSFVADGCAVQSNSSSPTGIEINGSAQAQAKSFCSVGGVLNGTRVTPAARSSCSAVADPFASIPYPTDLSCTRTNVRVQPGEVVTLDPGVYCNGLDLKGTTALSPGLYVIKNGPLTISSQAVVTGQGVTLFLTGHNSGFTINGGGGVNLVAPVNGQYAGILIMQDRNANPGDTNTLNGGSETALRGAIYTPAQALALTGNNFGQPNAFMPIIVDQVKFTGSSTLRASTDIQVAQPLPRLSGNARLAE